MALSDVMTKILGFLRAGYPDGIPEGDREPLLALLRRRLTDDEVVTLASELVGTGELPIDATDIRVAITHLTAEMPSPADTERVRARLLAAGWPVSDEFDASE
jgi:hypothetical protein